MNLLEVNQLSKSYRDKRILNNINFTCNTGEIIGAFGRNGSGKSTLLKILFGTLKANTLTIKINSRTIPQKKIIPSKTIGYLPQHSFLPKELKVREVISLFFENGDAQDAIFYAPRVASFDSKKINTLSLGELRYLELLLIGNLHHSFLLLDEPFSMIEPLFKEIIADFLMQLKKTKGIIITDHYYEDVLKITNRNFLIKNGNAIHIHDKNDLIKNEYLNSA